MDTLKKLDLKTVDVQEMCEIIAMATDSLTFQIVVQSLLDMHAKTGGACGETITAQQVAELLKFAKTQC